MADGVPETGESAMTERRRRKRFCLQLPIYMMGRARAKGRTANISSAGVLFKTYCELGVGQPIQFSIALPAPSPGHRTLVQCCGRVVRVEDQIDGDRTLHYIASTIERYLFRRERERPALVH
jgi:hypothetical protein